MKPKLRALLAGCGRMGTAQARLLAADNHLTLVAVSDVNHDCATRVGAELNVPAYGNYSNALAEIKPDVVVICSSNITHAPLTIEAARAGVKGVYCEKPMAINLGDARAMVEECRQRGVVLVINHQRRVSNGLYEMKRLIDSGAIGTIRRIRTQNAGDILSDGTHAIDSMLYLLNDQKPAWVLGQVHRDVDAIKKAEEKNPNVFFRAGHSIESGAIAIIQFQNGIRAECLFGDLIEQRTAYQDYIIEGDRGRIWRTGDSAKPNVFIDNGTPGEYVTGIDQWMYKPVPAAPGQYAPWHAIQGENDLGDSITVSYSMFARAISEGIDHPMSGEKALIGFEVIMAIYESARLRKKLPLPLTQDKFALDLMVEAGQI